MDFATAVGIIARQPKNRKGRKTVTAIVHRMRKNKEFQEFWKKVQEDAAQLRSARVPNEPESGGISQ